jgi:hypothetical protein
MWGADSTQFFSLEIMVRAQLFLAELVLYVDDFSEPVLSPEHNVTSTSPYV